MSFDFGRLPETAPEIRHEPFPRPGKRTASRLSAEKQLIFGDDIWDNPVPVHTAETYDPCHVTFADSAGKRFSLDKKALSKHLLLLGGIGSGKTNVFYFITEALLARQNPEDIIFIFDTKGDFYETFYCPYDPNHIVIGNNEKYRTCTTNWNIFGEVEAKAGCYQKSDEFTAKEIGKQLFAGRGSDMQPFFDLAAADLISKVLIDFERRADMTGDRSELNNLALVKWLRSATLADYMTLLNRNPDFLSAQLYFGDPGRGAEQKLTAQALGVFGYINSMLNDLFTGIFEDRYPGGEVSMRSLVRNRGKNGGKTVVFIEYDPSAGEVLSPMYRLLIDLAMKEALGQNAARRGNVFFIIDEFKLLPDLMHIDDALNFGRSLGVKVFAGLQSIDQLFEIYGEERGRSILSGFMNCFCFQTPDSNSRKYITERFGDNVYQLMFRSLDESVVHPREGHVIEDWDILRLETGQAAVDLNGERPFVFQFSDFKERHDIL